MPDSRTGTMPIPSRTRTIPDSLIPLFSLRPHPQAPLFDNPSDARAIILQIITEASSRNFQLTTEVAAYMRQLGFVSLWFYLKYILGHSGPYNMLDDDVHLDMCNFRQGDHCMRPGARAGLFISRGFYKSTIATHGADTWELTRDGNLRIFIVNAIADKAQEFMRNIRLNYEKNELHRFLYPETVPVKGQPRWNEEELVVPHRTRDYSEASVKSGSIGGASEGTHVNVLDIDDPIGLNDLNADHSSGLDMHRKIQWLGTSERSLLVVPRTDRVIIKGTRYAIDDFYQPLFEDMGHLTGYMDENFSLKAHGKWSIYYRKVLEDGHAICPQIMNEDEYYNLLETDYWTAVTQYMNSPYQSGLSEFSEMPVKEAIIRKTKDEKHVIEIPADNYKGQSELIPLEKCDVIMAVDPAGTDRGISAKTSRSAIVVWAQDSKERKYLIYSAGGHVDPLTLFGQIFKGADLYPGYIRKCVVESNGMQKILAPLLQREQLSQKSYLRFEGIPAQGDKNARIRNNVGVPLQKGQVYVCRPYHREFTEEAKIFPQSAWKKDFLDASEKAFVALRVPEDDYDAREDYGQWTHEDDDEASQEESAWATGRSRVTGY